MLVRNHLLPALLSAAGSLALPATGGASVGVGSLPLRFSKSGTFQISVFEDLHYGEAEDLDWGPRQDVNSERVLNSVLDAESPQLVVLNGDLITGENTYLENSTHYLDTIVRPLVQRNLTWASAYGNHDCNYNISTDDLLAREQRYVNSRTQKMVQGPNAGVTNYYLPVLSSDESEATPELILWFFDSRGGRAFQQLDSNGNTIQIPGFVDGSVAKWFLDTNEMLTDKYHRSIPSLVFVHIPIYAMAAAQKTDISPTHFPGINDDNPLAPQGITQGTYTGADIPFMQALLSVPKVLAIFSGHDHGDDWCYKWDSLLPGMNLTGNGVVLCFGRHSGHGGYGTWMRGGRQILLNEREMRKGVETWIRLEDGTESGRVRLNSTYGRDGYEVVGEKYSR